MKAENLYIEHLHDSIQQKNEALFDAYHTIEDLEKKLSKYESEIELLSMAIRDLEIKLQCETINRSDSSEVKYSV
jgi:chromosome segregation ATPase